MQGTPLSTVPSPAKNSRPVPAKPVGRHRDALAEINTASECLLFLVSAMFGADTPCHASDGPCPKIGDVITFLRRHFGREEERMRDTLYPRAAKHKAEHLAVLARLEAMHRHFRCGRYDPKIVLDELEAWAIDHIERHDKPLGRFLVSAESTGGLNAA